MGDIVSPYAVERLSILPISVFSVFGNNDGNQAQIMRVAQRENSNISFSQHDFGEIECESKTYFLTHYPEIADLAALSGKYSAVFYGHTHEMHDGKIEDTPIINPEKLASYPSNTISIAYYNFYY